MLTYPKHTFLESHLWKIGHSPSNYYEESEKVFWREKHLNAKILNLENAHQQRLQLKYWIKWLGQWIKLLWKWQLHDTKACVTFLFLKASPRIPSLQNFAFERKSTECSRSQKCIMLLNFTFSAVGLSSRIIYILPWRICTGSGVCTIQAATAVQFAECKDDLYLHNFTF